MPIYRKKPVEVEAIQWTGFNRAEILNFVGRAASWGDVTGMTIATLEGNHIASEGDYIIKGVAGEFYPCKPDIFRATYEQVGD
ncbi:hypothetical protein ACV1D9_20305 [Aeromonas allosaccharophila]